MATLDDEIKAAEKKMRQAYDALIEYVEKTGVSTGGYKAPSSPCGRPDIGQRSLRDARLETKAFQLKRPITAWPVRVPATPALV
jgi:hypothetical protein